MRARRITAYVAIVFSFALFLIQYSSAQLARGTEPASVVTDLKNLEPLKQAFLRDRGTVRLVALLSPV